jgi:hypothetical protein
LCDFASPGGDGERKLELFQDLIKNVENNKKYRKFTNRRILWKDANDSPWEAEEALWTEDWAGPIGGGTGGSSGLPSSPWSGCSRNGRA